MKARLVLLLTLVLALLFCGVSPSFAHRLDEYLQSTTVAVAKDHVTLQMDLTPGVAVANQVLANVDSNGDRNISKAEQEAYARRVARDLTVRIDGQPTTLRLVFYSFSSTPEMTKGTGDIVLRFEARVDSKVSSHHLAIENRHLSATSVYLVNGLVPRDQTLRILRQTRNIDQSIYGLDFSSDHPPQAAASNGASSTSWTVVETFAWQGVHHILTGYDHLLFLCALVLGAATLWDLVKVVTAFTLAHSMTLTLAALNLVHLPEAIVEPLISASIVFVALQNIFWPHRAHGRSRSAVAFFFGLFHGLGFAGGLLEIMHRMPHDMVLLAILGFSVGVEVGNQLVLVPLFSFVKAVRAPQPSPEKRARVALVLEECGSAAVAVAGVYYLTLALRQAAL